MNEQGVVNGHTAISFSDSGQDLIEAMATDASGYVYVAGTTNSPDFPAKDAAQAQPGASELMRSTDRGATWVKLANPPLAPGLQTQIVSHPSLPQVLFATTNNVYGSLYSSAIGKSTDGGATWRTVYALNGNAPTGADELTINPLNPSLIAADLSTGITTSTDGGETWSTPVCPVFQCGSSFDQLAADPLNAGRLAGVFPTGLYISSDWGRSFTKFGPDICCGSAVIAFDPVHQSWLYVAYNLGAQGNLFLSTDGGNSWTTKSVPSIQLSAIQTLVADPEMANVLYATTVNGLYESPDGGTTWNLLNNTPPPPGIAVLRRSCGPGGGLFTPSVFSPDFGSTWKSMPFREVTDIATALAVPCMPRGH